MSDIDGTLLNEGEPTAGLVTLSRLLERHRDRICLVYATGRSFESTWEIVERGVLPVPDGVAPFVGSEAWLPPWRKPEEAYARFIAEGWDRRAVEETAAGLDDLALQPTEFQTHHKISFYTSDDGAADTLRDRLRERGLPARVVFSGGRYVDVLPGVAGKRTASAWIRCRLCSHCDRTLVCGDSLNDLDILSDPVVDGVTVGNAEADLCRLLAGGHVYHAKLPWAAGVLEGAEVHRFWP